jgi:nitroimidazol reductase NimA-like FMN-containing flavoprotein (pyridoxamine 5'-phosphate oxidase superfamily)
MPDDEADLGNSAWRVMERLGEAECMELLADAGAGRLVFNSRYGPTALPVVFKVDGESLVLGTWDPVFDEDLRTGIEHADYQVAVEADQIDLPTREGWIVLVRGAAHHLDTEAERAPFINAGLEPWVEDVPAHFIRVIPTTIYGVRSHRRA